MKQAGIEVLRVFTELESELLDTVMEVSDQLVPVLVKIGDVIKDENSATVFDSAKNILKAQLDQSDEITENFDEFFDQNMKIFYANENDRMAAANIIYEIADYWETLSYLYLNTKAEGSTDWLNKKSTRDTILKQIAIFTADFHWNEIREVGEFIVELVEEISTIFDSIPDDDTLISGYITQIFDVEWDEIKIIKENLENYIPDLLIIGDGLLQARDEIFGDPDVDGYDGEYDGESSINELLSELFGIPQ